MRGRRSSWTQEHRAGFTLIEVIGALVIFAVGVLMVIQSSGALSRQMAFSARTSQIVTLTHEWLDSLEAVPFDSLTEGTVAETLSVGGLSYERSAGISRLTAVLMRLDVTLSPVGSVPSAPTYRGTSYSAAAW